MRAAAKSTAVAVPRTIHERPTKRIEQTSLRIARRFLDAEDEERHQAARKVLVEIALMIC